MITINAHFHPLTDSIDMEITEERYNLIADNFIYPLCDIHPNNENEIAIKYSNGKDFAAPISFCCLEYQQKIMNDLNSFLFYNPHRPESS